MSLPNQCASLDAAMTLPLYSQHNRRRASERARWPKEDED
jgi:hypothetical protein